MELVVAIICLLWRDSCDEYVEVGLESVSSCCVCVFWYVRVSAVVSSA